jgi:ferredoxin
MAGTLESCSFCPQLCRHVCPVAVATGREAASPAKIMSAVLMAGRAHIPPEDAARAAALCTGCGACREHCKYSVDVPALLAEARTRYGHAAEVTAPRPPQGEGELVAVICDQRSWASVLAIALDQPVASLSTTDHLGWAALEHRDRAAPHLTRLNAALAGRKAVSACSQCLAVLDAAHVPRIRLDELLPPEWDGPVYSCHGDLPFPGQSVQDSPTCCGAHGPLASVHPQLAADVAREAASRLPPEPVATADSACRNALRSAGAQVVDAVDLLLDKHPHPST